MNLKKFGTNDIVIKSMNYDKVTDLTSVPVSSFSNYA